MGICSFSAIRTRSANEVASILCIILLRWISRVISLMPSSAAACLFRRPLSTSGNTSRSRGVSVEKRPTRWASSARVERCLRSRRIAARTAAINSLSPTGLVKKSTAPPWMARTDDGMSPCPVRNTIGGWTSHDNCLWNSSPLTSGSSDRPCV